MADDSDDTLVERALSLCWKALRESVAYFSAFLIASFVFICLGSFFVLLDLFVAQTSVLIVIGGIFAGIGGLVFSVLSVCVIIFWVIKISRGLFRYTKDMAKKQRQEAREQKKIAKQTEEASARESQIQQEFTESARTVANKVLQDLPLIMGQMPPDIQQHLFVIVQQQMMKAKIEYFLSDPLNSEHILNRRSLASTLIHELRIYFSKTVWNPYSATDCIFEAIILWKGAMEKGDRPSYENQPIPPPPMNPMMGVPQQPPQPSMMNMMPSAPAPTMSMVGPPMNPMGMPSQSPMMMAPPAQNPFLPSNPPMNQMGPQVQNPFLPSASPMNPAPFYNPNYQAPPPPPPPNMNPQSFYQQPMYG